MENTVISIEDAANISGMKPSALRYRVKADGLKPLRGRFYDREALANLAKWKRGFKRRAGGNRQDGTNGQDECVRCGVKDYGNEVRNGLCFDCFCHEYCLRIEKKRNR